MIDTPTMSVAKLYLSAREHKVISTPHDRPPRPAASQYSTQSLLTRDYRPLSTTRSLDTDWASPTLKMGGVLVVPVVATRIYLAAQDHLLPNDDFHYEEVTGIKADPNMCADFGGKCNVSRDASMTITMENSMRMWPDDADIAVFSTTDSTIDPRVGGIETVVSASNILGPIATHTYTSNENLTQVYITNAGTAPICLSKIVISLDNREPVEISGQLGKLCQAGTYNSEVVFDNVFDSRGTCVWIDRHGSNGIKIPGLSFDLTSTADETTTKIQSLEDICKPPFIRETPVGKMSTKRESNPDHDFDQRLVKSNSFTSSAVTLCEDWFSLGPHFVSSIEGLFCDMNTRELLPVCDQNTQGQCFNDDLDEVVERTATIGDGEDGADPRNVKRDEPVKIIRSFKHVDIWN
jgi:hypothetical protein